MLLIKTKVQPSEGRGLGLFAAQNIAKNKIVWVEVDGFDRKFTKEEYEHFPEVVKEWMVEYAPYDGKFHCVDLDNMRFCNHSTKPNINLKGKYYIANRNIKEGEEIFADYNEFDILFKSGEYSFKII